MAQTEEEEEQMTINIASSYMNSVVENSQANWNHQKDDGRSFVGGFVQSLKMLPKAMMKGPGPSSSRPESSRPSSSRPESSRPSSSRLATISSGSATPFPTEVAEVSRVPFVESPQPLMNVPLLEDHSPASAYDPHGHDTWEYGVPENDRNNHALDYEFQNYYAHNYNTHPQQSVIPTVHQISPARSEANDANHLLHPNSALHYDSGDGFSHSSLNGFLPGLASDSATASSSVQTPSGPSSPPHLRVQKFFKSLYRLPWVSSRITSTYIARKRSDGRPPTNKLPATSWYFRPRNSLDLLSSGESSNPASPISLAEPSEFVQTIVASPRTFSGSPQRHHQRTPSKRNASPSISPHPTRHPKHSHNPDSPTVKAHARRRRVRHTSTSSAITRSPQGSREKMERARTVSDSGYHASAPPCVVPSYPYGYCSFPYSPLPQPLFVLTPSSPSVSVDGCTMMHQAVPLYVISPSVLPMAA